MDPDDENDIGNGRYEEGEGDDHSPQKPRELPPDLPRSLDGRKNYSSYNQETEVYDAWQGEIGQDGVDVRRRC